MIVQELVWYIQDLLDRPGVKLLLGSLAFGTSFMVGFVTEMGEGLYALISELELLALIAFYGAAFWLSARLVQLFITTTRPFIVMSLRGWRNGLMRIWKGTEAITYWPLWLRYRLRRHVYLYYLVWWAAIIGLLVWGTLEANDPLAAVPLSYLGWLVFQATGLLVFGFVALSLYAVAEFKRGRLEIPASDDATRKLLQSARPLGLRLALQTLAIPVSLMFFLSIGGTLGRLYVSIVKYGEPSVAIDFAGSEGDSRGSILLSTGTGVIYFPAETRIGTLVPIDRIDKIEVLEAPRTTKN